MDILNIDDVAAEETAAERRALFAYEKVAEDHFRVAPFPSPLLRLYGGQLIAQAAGAAQLTVTPDRSLHSLHAYFAEGGATDRPIDYHAVRERDGRSFSTRRVEARQDGRTVLSLACSFHIAEGGPSHQAAMPQGLPDPETLPSLHDQVVAMGEALPVRHRPFWRRLSLFDWRPVEPYHFLDPPQGLPARRHFWFRLRMPIGDDPAEHRRTLAYASDMHTLHTGFVPTGIGWASDYVQSSSLDHAMWFHGDARPDEWMLFALDSPGMAQALALGGGLMFARDGRLIATVMQQGLMRVLDAPRTSGL